MVPSAAIQNGPQGSYVFVVKSDKTVEVKPVTVSFTQKNVASIASGLNPGEVVVMDGQESCNPNKVDPHAGGTSGNRNGQPSAGQSSASENQVSPPQPPSGEASSGQTSPAQPSPAGTR